MLLKSLVFLSKISGDCSIIFISIDLNLPKYAAHSVADLDIARVAVGYFCSMKNRARHKASSAPASLPSIIGTIRLG